MLINFLHVCLTTLLLFYRAEGNIEQGDSDRREDAPVNIGEV